MVKILFTRQA